MLVSASYLLITLGSVDRNTRLLESKTAQRAGLLFHRRVGWMPEPFQYRKSHMVQSFTVTQLTGILKPANNELENSDILLRFIKHFCFLSSNFLKRCRQPTWFPLGGAVRSKPKTSRLCLVDSHTVAIEPNGSERVKSKSPFNTAVQCCTMMIRENM